MAFGRLTWISKTGCPLRVLQDLSVHVRPLYGDHCSCQADKGKVERILSWPGLHYGNLIKIINVVLEIWCYFPYKTQKSTLFKPLFVLFARVKNDYKENIIFHSCLQGPTNILPIDLMHILCIWSCLWSIMYFVQLETSIGHFIVIVQRMIKDMFRYRLNILQFCINHDF